MIAERSPRKNVLVVASVAPDACFRGVARFARENGWHLVADMMYTGAFPRGWKGDGIVALIGYQPELVRHIQAAGAPCVALTLADEFVPFPSIGPDDVVIGRLAADHLLERGYRHFAWAPFISDKINRERLLGFEARLADHGCTSLSLPPVHRRIGCYWHDDWSEYRRSLVARIQELPRPTAIFAANDSVAAEIINVCHDRGIAVPDEIAVIGVGNDETVCETLPVALSSVHIDIAEMAYRAATMLDDLLRGEVVPKLSRIEPKGVITRISTDIRAVGNLHVAQALSYIAENYPNPMLNVTDVAEAVGMSRRHLERSFRTETGCTIYEHIVKRRMQEASRLLRSHPRAKVSAIGELVGLGGAGNFFRTFRRYFGESPKAHRAAAQRASGVSFESQDPVRESA